MQAVIVAGGFGTRMSSYPPKALLDIGGKALIERQLQIIKKAGITSVVICTGYKSETIEKHVFSKNTELKIVFSREKEPLGTGGAIKFAENLIYDDFILIYGDIFFDFELKKMLVFHKKKKSRITVLVHNTDHPWDSDLVVLDAEKRISAIYKRPHEAIKSNTSKSSLYVVSRDVVKDMPSGKSDFVETVENNVKKGNVYGYLSDEKVIDIGTPERYKRVKKAFEANVKERD